MNKNYFKFLTALLFASTISLVLTPSCNHKSKAEYEQNEGEEENDEYDSPDKAADFETFRSLDVTIGKVPYGRFWDAILETENLKNVTPSSTPSTDALTPLTWIERGSNSDAVGPSNANTRSGNEVTSGRMRAVWVDLADPTRKTVWVGGVAGGLWKTNDISSVPASWTLVNDYLSNLAIASICQDPTNTNIMYFSTGESYRTGGGVGGVGVFKSTDHGVTWNLLTNPAVTVLVNSTKILCDNLGNVYVNSQGISIAAGLQRSSDGGNTWVSINPFTTGTSATSRIIDFEISSTGAMHVVGGFYDSAPGIGGYRYTASPATATSASGWNTPTTLYPIPTTSGARVEITTAGNTIYAAISSNGSGAGTENIDKVAKSVDGGNNWTTTNLTATNITDLNGSGGGQGTYSNTIGVDPSDPNIVIVGSLNLLKSTNGGATFSKLTTWVGSSLQYIHADQHDITWYDNGNKMLVASDGGLFYSTNKGVSFLDKNVGLRLKQFYGVTIHPTNTNYFLAGAQDNGTHQFSNPGLSSSVEVLGGDGGFTGIDQDEPQFQSGAYVYANFRRSSNSGATWSSSGSANTSGLFINPYDYDNVGNKVYAGYAAGQFLRWEDPHSGFNFTPVTVPEFGTGTVTSTTVSPTVANRVYFGVFSSKVYRLDNANSAAPIVTDISPTGIQAATYISSVIEGLASNQNLLVTQSRTTAGFTHVWSTTNGGTSWVACDGNLPNIPVYWAAYHPDGDTKAYIATETGVWSTDLINGTSTIWTPETTFPTVKTSMLKYRASDRTIAASTYGRGLWTAIIPNTNCTAAAVSTQPTNVSICAGSNTSMSITATGTPTLNYQWQLSTAGAGGPWTDITANAIYSNVTTASLTITAATVSMSTYQYRCVVTGNCAPLTATSNPAVLTVNAAPSAPTVTTPIAYCQGATATQLTATGTGLLWYTAATGGTGSATAPTPTTTAAGTTIFYVSQTVSTCESPRAAITVNVTATPSAPTVTSPISYCQGATATALTATGTNLLWYTVATGGTGSATAPTPSTATVGSTTFYVSQSTGTCEGPRAAITVNITAVPAAPVVTTPISYCQGVTATALTATGTNLLWYTVATGGTGSATAPIPSTATVGSTTFYVSQTTGCESPRAAIVVNIVAGTAAPTVATPVAYCQGATATQLTATGTGLLWYTAATGGTGSATAPTPTTTAAGTTIYYVSQTSGICESPRAAITVNVTATPVAPTVTSPISYCQNATATALTATGTNLKWYTVATGGTALAGAPTPSTATLGTTIYYVSQSTGTCEGPRAAITVNVVAVTAAPTAATPITYCQGATATALTATGTSLLWYTVATGGTGSTTAPTPSTTTVGSTTFYVSQTSGCGESPRTAIVVTINATPAAPTATTPITYCQGATATALTATGTGLLWYTVATGGTGSATAPTPSTSTVGSTTFYVSQTTGVCEGPRAAVVVNVTALPVAPTITTPIAYCQGATATALTATGTGLLWYTTATGGIGSTTAPTPSTAVVGSITYYVSQTTGTCEGPRAAITVTVNAIPAAPTVTTAVVYCQGATAIALTATGTNLLWYTTATGGIGSTTAPIPATTTVGNTIYYVSQTSTNCESPRAAITVTVNATPVAPTVTSPVSYCQGGTAVALTATGTNLKWYTVATGGTGSATAPTPSTATVGSTTFYVSQTTGVCEGPRAAIVVNVNAGPAITLQPVDINTCATTATFTATASGTNLTYQWFLSTDGGATYTAMTGQTSSTLVLTGLTTAQANNKYRLVVSSASCSSATSNAVSVKVGTNPVVVLTAAPVVAFNPYTNGGLFTTVSPVGNYTYQWKRNNNTISNTTTSITKANGLLDDFGSYQVTVTDAATGCFGVSNVISVSDIPSTNEQLFASPNPTNGMVRISYYSSTTAPQARTVTIYDDKGARLMNKNLTFVGRYGSVDIDLSRQIAGTYIFILRDASGQELAAQKVIKY